MYVGGTLYRYTYTFWDTYIYIYIINLSAGDV